MPSDSVLWLDPPAKNDLPSTIPFTPEQRAEYEAAQQQKPNAPAGTGQARSQNNDPVPAPGQGNR